jgi:DNA-binding transcriptional LysR family regulator
MTLGSHGAVVAAAVAGLGVTLVSRQAVRRELDSGLLVELPVAGTPLDRPWHVVTQSAPTAPTELLINHLMAHRELGWQENHTDSPRGRSHRRTSTPAREGAGHSRADPG